jgi:hypothetical protein
MQIKVNHLDKVETVPVTVIPSPISPAEIVELLRELDNSMFRSVVKATKKIRWSDRIYASAVKEINE